MFTRAAVISILVILGTPASSAQTDALCDDTEVREMLRDGSTASEVAEECDMSLDLVHYIRSKSRGQTDPATDPDPEINIEPSHHRLSPGQPVGECGCWGFVPFNHRQPHPHCASGYATAQQCPAMCPAGGYMWRGVCL